MLHIERLHGTIDALSARALERLARVQDGLRLALAWLQHAALLDIAAIEAVAVQMYECSGALPWEGAQLSRRHQADSAPPSGTVLIAVDGSQIYPDRHAAILYYLLQVGGVIFRYNGETPSVRSLELLEYDDEALFDQRGGILSVEAIGMERLVLELSFLADLVSDERKRNKDAPMLALMDGPLLWSYPDRGAASQAGLERSLEALRRLRDLRAVPVGYIDRPGGHPCLDLLSALHTARGSETDAFPALRLSDREVMEVFLQPGERSDWFTRTTASQQGYREAGHEICFCYLNTGTAGRPTIARVEVPCWAVDAASPAVVQAALLHQSRALEGYPYALARAHEEALITTQDKAALEDAIQRALIAKGMLMRPSEKARQKSYLGRRTAGSGQGFRAARSRG